MAAAGAVVLGVGRSGTSAVTRALVAAGFYAGASSELMAANSGNPAGYWEHLAVVRANEEILERIGGTWFTPPSFEAQRAAAGWARPMLQSELSRLLVEAGTAPLAVKDPRIGVLLELWGPLIDPALHPVLVIRNPVEIALSLTARDGTPTAFALASWELHITRLLDYLDGRTVTVAPFAQLLGSGEAVRSFVGEVAGRLASERLTHIHPSAAETAIERELYRSRAAICDLGAYLTGRQEQIWHFLEGLSLGSQTLEVPGELTRPSEVARSLTEYEDDRVRQLRYVNELRAQVAAQQTEIEELGRRAEVAERGHDLAGRSLIAMKTSNSWRLTAPLRKVVGLLRRV